MRIAWFLVLVPLSLFSCHNAARPIPPLSIPEQPHPFYYSDDRPIDLNLDSTRVTLATSRPMPETAITTLHAIGVETDSVRALPTRPGVAHWTVYLRVGTSKATAVQAARRLRMTEGVSFASNAYFYPPDGTPLRVINEMIVRFHPGTPASEIERLNRSLAVHIVEHDPGDPLRYILSFPERCEVTPLAVASFYAEQPGVEYATPNFVITIHNRVGPAK